MSLTSLFFKSFGLLIAFGKNYFIPETAESFLSKRNLCLGYTWNWKVKNSSQINTLQMAFINSSHTTELIVFMEGKAVANCITDSHLLRCEQKICLDNSYLIFRTGEPSEKSSNVIINNEEVFLNSRKVPNLNNVEYHPQNINLKDLANLIRNKKTGFYTCSAISESVLTAQQKLKQRISLILEKNSFNEISNSFQNLDQTKNLIEKIIDNAEQLLSASKDFFDEIKNTKPTLIHRSIANLSKLKKWLIISDFIDIHLVQEGIFALDREDEKNFIKTISKLDYLLILGTKKNNYKWIRTLKDQNPCCKVILICNDCTESQPFPVDFIIKGSVQEIIPELERLILEKA